MQFSKAIACAILSIASAIPASDLYQRAESGNALRDGTHGSMTNAAQVVDTLGRQLQSGDGHPTADMISAFITGADSQIDNFAAFLGEALDPITFGGASAIASLALGPFAQSVTNGAEVLLSNLVAAPIDIVAGPAMKAFTQNLAKVSAAAKANKVDTQKLDKVTAQLNAKIAAASKSLASASPSAKAIVSAANPTAKAIAATSAVALAATGVSSAKAIVATSAVGLAAGVSSAKAIIATSAIDNLAAATGIPSSAPKAKRAETGNALRDGAHGSLTNAAQVQDTLSRQLQSGDGHPTADMISAFITGADSQIDNLAAFLGEALDPVTFGASGAIAAVALGPFAQSVTNGAEVLLSNLVAAPIDLVAGPAMKAYVNNLAKISAAAKANKIDTAKLDKVAAQLNVRIAAATTKAKRAESGNALRDGTHGSMTNAAQVVDTLGRQLQSGDGHPTADMISAFITGADSQIDNFAAFLGEALDPVTFGGASAIASLALGPFAQSVTNGAEVLLSNLVAAPIDIVAGPALKSFTKNLAKVSAAAKANKIDTQKLDKVTGQLNDKIAAATASLKTTSAALNAAVPTLTGEVWQIPTFGVAMNAPSFSVSSISLPKMSAIAAAVTTGWSDILDDSAAPTGAAAPLEDANVPSAPLEDASVPTAAPYIL